MVIDSSQNTDRLITGHRYFSTRQLRTPLAALLFDGTETSSLIAPENPYGMAHGIWSPRIKTWRDMGVDMDEMEYGSCASDIGYANPTLYLKFLISVRMIAEDGDRTINERITAVKEVLKDHEFSSFTRKLGGQSRVIDQLFIPIVSTIPGINSTVAETLWKAGMRTPHKLASTLDAKLLALSGIGKKSLVAIRLFCDTFAGDQYAERLDVGA